MNVISAGLVTARTNAVDGMFTSDQLFEILSVLTNQLYFCIAYSGGLDSHVLLHAMNNIVAKHPQIKLRAIHINHGLNPNANKWKQHCARVCHNLNIEFDSQSVTLNIKPGDSIEAKARYARYGCFEKLLHANENLLTAHNQNDQSETLLLQLLRGAGVKGLAAMPAKRSFSRGFLLRPLLAFTRKQLEEYADQHNIKWIEDDSNLEMRFDRNYIRHQVMPTLQQRWPEALTTLTRSGKHCAESAQLLDILADIDLRSVRDESEKTLRIGSLGKLSKARQHNLMRRWFVTQGHQVPSTKHLEQIFKTVLGACQSAQPQVNWDNSEVRRYQNRLYLMTPLSSHDCSQIIPWDLHGILRLPHDLGTLTAKKVIDYGICAALDVSNITVRFRQGGERCRPLGRQQTHSLKKLFQEWEVPPWQRHRIPLIYNGDTLIAVVGYCICEGYAVKRNQNERGYDIVINN